MVLYSFMARREHGNFLRHVKRGAGGLPRKYSVVAARGSRAGTGGVPPPDWSQCGSQAGRGACRHKGLPPRRLPAKIRGMKKCNWPVLFGVCASLGTQAETTPLNDPLEEQKETLITCELTQAPKRAEVPV